MKVGYIMGMYTGIRFKGYVKPEFRAVFEDIALNGDWDESNVPEFKEFGKLNRSCFIPCGGLSYMPDEWETEPYSIHSQATDGFERNFDKDTGYWSFQCSLKNYECEIEQFFELLPVFIESIEYLEYFYEEWQYSKKYSLINGEIIEISDRFKKYN